MSPRAARSLGLASALLAGACGGAPSQPERAPAAHLGRLRLPATCDVVAGAAGGAEARPVQDALWTLSMLGDTCRAQAHRLATDGAQPPHVRGMALELLAMMRDARARPLVEDRGREDDIRPARRRARIIFHARE